MGRCWWGLGVYSLTGIHRFSPREAKCGLLWVGRAPGAHEDAKAGVGEGIQCSLLSEIELSFLSERSLHITVTIDGSIILKLIVNIS